MLITPSQIKEKANRRYKPAVIAWLSGDESYFPMRLPCDLKIPRDASHSAVVAWTEQLRSRSKQQLGFGYRLDLTVSRNRRHGLNPYPSDIWFETLDDLVRFIGKRADFSRLSSAVTNVRSKFPQLEPWIRTKWAKLGELEPTLDDLMLVLEYLAEHPRPGCYIRELPLPVSTKLIQRHKQLLGEWLVLVTPEAVDHSVLDLRDFERRFGFAYPRKHILLRTLDDSLLQRLQLPFDELSLPAEAMDRLPVHDPIVFVIENKVTMINLLTLPPVPGGIAMGALGNNLVEYEKIGWLKKARIFYWGDIDIEGLAILGKFREKFPQTISFAMDAESLEQHRSLTTPWLPSRVPKEPTALTESELSAFRLCLEQGVRLEQEHLPQSYVHNCLRRLLSESI